MKMEMNYAAPHDLRSFFEVGLARRVPFFINTAPGIVLNVGAGQKHIRDAVELDWPAWDADNQPLPYTDGSVAEIHAYHFLEHVKDPVAMLREFQRALRPGGIVNIAVPYYNAQIFAHDMDHKRPFCEATWEQLFSNPYYAKNHAGWEFDIGFNMIIGLVERNLCLFTQLIRR